MTHEGISREIASLPPEGQHQVADFVAFLHQRYGRTGKPKELTASDIANDSFIGMWRDREDMADSTAWVRRRREQECVR